MNNLKEKTPTEMSVQVENKDIIPTHNAVVKQTADIDGFLAKREEFIKKVSAICVEGKDYHIIQGKKSLAKGGAEKIASIFQWNATFIKDSEALEMLGELPGLVAFKCTLAKGTKFVGEGRGASSLAKNANDPNKTLKMAQKSAFIDAVLRSSGLSDFFTQDLEDMPAHEIGTPTSQNIAPQGKPSEKQTELIAKLTDQKGINLDQIIDAGFDVNNLTGGKEGTASELIDYLIKYIPTYGEVSKESDYFVKDLQECDSVESYNKIKTEIQLAKENGKLSDYAWKRIMKVAIETASRLQSH